MTFYLMNIYLNILRNNGQHVEVVSFYRNCCCRLLKVPHCHTNYEKTSIQLAAEAMKVDN